MSRRQEKCQQRQGIQSPDGTDALTVGVNVTLTGPGSTESRPGGGMEVKVKVLQGRTPESEAIARGITATATSSHHGRPVTAPAAISDEKKLDIEQISNETEGVEFKFTRGSSHFQDPDHVTKESDDVMEIEVLPISRTNVEGLPIYHRTVATLSSGKHRDVVYIDGKIEARSSHEQAFIKEDVSTTGIRELSLKQESKLEKTSFIIENLDGDTDMKNTPSQCGCEDSDKDYTVTETENIEIHTDSIELKICGTMTTSTRDSAKDIPGSGFPTEEFEKPPLIKKTGSLFNDETEKCPREECLPICPKRSKNIDMSEDKKGEGVSAEEERHDITMKAELSFKLSRTITPDEAQRESIKPTESGTLTGEFKVVQDDGGEMKTADLELLIQETRYVSPTDSFTDVVHETHAIVSQSAPMIETRGKDLQMDDAKSENMNNKKYEDMFRSVSLESFSEEVYELTVVTEEMADGERQTCTCSGDQDNRDDKGIQSDSVQKVTSETMTSNINLLDLDETTRRFRELLSESNLVDQGMATDMVHTLSMATSISEDRLNNEDFAATTATEDNIDKASPEKKVDTNNNNITDSNWSEKIDKGDETPESELSSCICYEIETFEASSSRGDIAVECKIEGTVGQELTQNKGMQSDAIEESQVGTMTSDIEIDYTEEHVTEDTSKIMSYDGGSEESLPQECHCSLEDKKSVTSISSRKSTTDVTEICIRTEESTTQNYSTMPGGVPLDVTERGRKPEITEDDILDDDGVTFDTRRYSRTTADQTREGRSPLRDQLISPTNGPARNCGTNESLISFMRDLWSELENTNPPPLTTEPGDDTLFRTYRHQMEPEESINKPVPSHTTQSSSEITEEKISTHEDGTDISELGDVDDSLFAVSSNDTELTAEISVTMTVVDEAGDNLQEQLNADDDMTDMLFMQMLDNDNILEGEAVDIVQRIVNLPGFDELLMDSTTMTDPHGMEDKSQMVDMCVQSDTILSVHSGGSIGKSSARSVPLVVDKKEVSFRRGLVTNNQQLESGDETEKESEAEPHEEKQEKAVDGSERTNIPSKCSLKECCPGYANQESEDYASKQDSDFLSETEEDSASKSQSADEDSAMPELQDVGEIDKPVEDELPAPTEADHKSSEPGLTTVCSKTSGKIGTISVTDTVAIDTDAITVRSSATVMKTGTRSVTDTVTLKTDSLTIKSSLTVTKPYSTDSIPSRKSEITATKEPPDEVDHVSIKSDNEPKEVHSDTEAIPDQAGDVLCTGECIDDICKKKSVPQANEETDTEQVQPDNICTECSVTSTKEIPSLTETSPECCEDICSLILTEMETSIGTTDDIEIQTDRISTKSAAMTTEELSNETETTVEQNEDLTNKVQDEMGTDDVAVDEIGEEAVIIQDQSVDLTIRRSPTWTKTEVPCPCATDTAPVEKDENINESKPALATEETENITDAVPVQTDDISMKSNSTMTANDLPKETGLVPEETHETTSKSSIIVKIKEELLVFSDFKAEGDLGDTEELKKPTSSLSMQTECVSAKNSSTMNDQESKDDQEISQTETGFTLIKENITDIKTKTDILTDKDGTVHLDKEDKVEIISTTIVKSNPVLPIMDENCHKCCAVKSDMTVQDCIKCCGHFGADKDILEKKSPESMLEMSRKRSCVDLEQERLDSDDVTDTGVQSDEIPTREASTGEHIALNNTSELLSSVSMQCDPIHTTHIGTSMSASSKSAHSMLTKMNVQSDPTLKKNLTFEDHIEKKITTQSYHAVNEISSAMVENSLSGLAVSVEDECTISKQSMTDTDSDLFDSSKIPQDFVKETDTPIMSIVQINAPDHLIHLISVSVQNETISTRNSSTTTELKLTELTDSRIDVKESKDSKLEISTTLTTETQINIEEVAVDPDKQNVDTTEDKPAVTENISYTKRASVSDKIMQTKSSKAISTMTDTMPSHFSDRVVQYGATVRSYVTTSTHSDGGNREGHETSRNIAEEIQILLHEKTIKTVDMDSPDFIIRDYMTESSSKLTDGPDVTPSAEKIEDEVPELVETLGPARVEIAEAEGDFRPRDDENMDNDGIDFLMPEGDFLMPADGVPATPPASPAVLSEPTVAPISEKQDGRYTMSDGPMEMLYDVRLPDSHLEHPESPPRSRESESSRPDSPAGEQMPPCTESPQPGQTIGKVFLTADNLQITGIGISSDSNPPQTECYSSMTEGDYMLHKIKKLAAPTPSQTSQTDREDLVSSAECIDCEPCHPEMKRKKKYRAPPPPPLSTEKPAEEVKEEEPAVQSSGEQESSPQEREEMEKPLQRKGSFRKSLFKKLKFEKTVKQKSSAKGSEDQSTQKQRGSNKGGAKVQPESPPVKIKTEPSIHRKKCVPLSDFPDKTFSKPDSRKSDQVQTKPKLTPKPPLRLTSTDRTFRSRGRCQNRTDELPALEDRTDVRPSCAAKVQDEILQQLGHKLQMIGQPRKREDTSPRRAIMIGRDLPPIIGSVPLDPDRDCLELRDLTRIQSDGTDDGALLISLDNPPPGTEVVVQTAESPGKAHSLKIRSTQPGEDARAAAIGLIKAKATHLAPRRVISPIRFQPRTHYLMRPSSPTNIPPELRITQLQPYDHCGGRDGMNTQALTNLVLESPPVGTAYVVFPVPTDGTQSDDGAQRVLSDHIHRQADAVSVAIVDNNIVPYPHSNPCMCQDHCQNRVCLNQPQRVYAPAPDWIGARQCTRNLCSRQGTRRWCSVHHTFHRD